MGEPGEEVNEPGLSQREAARESLQCGFGGKIALLPRKGSVAPVQALRRGGTAQARRPEGPGAGEGTRFARIPLMRRAWGEVPRGSGRAWR